MNDTAAEEVVDYVEQEIGPYIRKVLINDLKDFDFEVRIYGGSQAYGGPEEGGWWYTHYDLIKTIPVHGLLAAWRKYKETEKRMKGQGKDSFYQDIQEPTADMRMSAPDDEYEQEGMWIARGWRTSQYKKYAVKLNLPQTPTGETRRPPHYE